MRRWDNFSFLERGVNDPGGEAGKDDFTDGSGQIAAAEAGAIAGPFAGNGGADADPEELKLAGSLMAGARRIYVYAPGPAVALGDLLFYRLSRFGMSVRMMAASGHELLESLAHVQREDVVLLFNFTRLLPETEVILDCVQRVGCSAVMITDREKFRYGAQVEAAFYVSRGEMGEFHSMVTPLLLIEQMILSIGCLIRKKCCPSLNIWASCGRDMPASCRGGRREGEVMSVEGGEK
ncbi:MULTISPECIES: MurR/RpiR family transcriptional regulator [unclassified Paenibacillus]|uniref:MurR/RpiR family transcriptional regulator n=1 Tax=unclassified Paenibacillus TaxID=185978 RepID=UPI0030FCB1C2